MELRRPAGKRQQWARAVFAILIVALIAPLVVRSWRSSQDDGPSIQVVSPDGIVTDVSLAQMKSGTLIVRPGRYQNQYGSWRDEGVYSGVLLSELLPHGDYAFVEAVADDGYRVRLDRWRVEDLEFPVVLAFAFNGVSVPEWQDGFRIAVLPAGGEVSNADYGAVSAGSYWIQRVVRLVMHPSS